MSECVIDRRTKGTATHQPPHHTEDIAAIATPSGPVRSRGYLTLARLMRSISLSIDVASNGILCRREHGKTDDKRTCTAATCSNLPTTSQQPPNNLPTTTQQPLIKLLSSLVHVNRHATSLPFEFDKEMKEAAYQVRHLIHDHTQSPGVHCVETASELCQPRKGKKRSTTRAQKTHPRARTPLNPPEAVYCDPFKISGAA